MPPLTLSHSTTTVPLKPSTGFQDDDANGVVGRAGRCCLPAAVGAVITDRCVACRGSGDEELVVGVADVGEVVGAQQQPRPARRMGDHRLVSGHVDTPTAARNSVKDASSLEVNSSASCIVLEQPYTAKLSRPA